MNTRQSEIIELLQKDERVAVRWLAQHFNVSPMTIRRDMAMLEEPLRVRAAGASSLV
jgi:DeoR/GlpR family transcriptional regulator of sugar metabolism